MDKYICDKFSKREKISEDNKPNNIILQEEISAFFFLTVPFAPLVEEGKTGISFAELFKMKLFCPQKIKYLLTKMEENGLITVTVIIIEKKRRKYEQTFIDGHTCPD